MDMTFSKLKVHQLEGFAKSSIGLYVKTRFDHPLNLKWGILIKVEYTPLSHLVTVTQQIDGLCHRQSGIH